MKARVPLLRLGGTYTRAYLSLCVSDALSGLDTLYHISSRHSLTRLRFSISLPAARARERSIPKLSWYGRVRVGTLGCITCLGVYFQIDDYLFFCAHIDAYETSARRTGEKLRPEVELDITVAVLDRLKQHAKDSGWSPRSVQKDILILACPDRDEYAYTVSNGIADFLTEPREQLFLMIKTNSRGFIIQPGARDKYGKHEFELVEKPATEESEPPAPDGYERVTYAPFPRSQWTYEAEVGWGRDH